MEPKIKSALEAIKLPLIHKSPLDLNYVRSAEVDGEGKVTLLLELRAPHLNHKDAIKAQCLEALSMVAGIKSVDVQILEKSTKKAEAKKPSEAPTENLMAEVKLILGVASGKGGVGKSTVSANLATALALQGLKVGVLDADIYGPSMNMMFQVQEAPIVHEDKSVTPVVVAGGIKVISMAMFAESDKAVIWRGPMASQMIQNFLTRVRWGSLDVLLIDFPPGTGDIQLTLTQNSLLTGAAIVTTPQNVSVIDARKGLQMFETVSVPVLGIIENMSFFQTPDGTKHHIFRQGGGTRIADSLGLPFLGEIPMEPAIADGGDFGVPLCRSNPNSPAAKQFFHIAEDLYQKLCLQKESEGGLGSYSLTWQELEIEQ